VTWLEAIQQELVAAGRGGEAIPEYIEHQMTMGPATAQVPGGSCPASYAGFTTSWTSRPGDFCTKVHPNESWFLHNGAGQRIYRAAGTNSWYVMNIHAPGWRSYIASKIPEIAADFWLDAAFLDDVWATANRPRNQETNSNGVCQECGTDAQWHAANVLALQGIKASASMMGRPVYINSDDSDVFVDQVDGHMIENFGPSWGTTFITEEETLMRMDHVEANVVAGKDVYLVSQGNSNAETARFRYGHALYLLVSGPRVSYRFHNAGIYVTLWDFPEYQFNLGDPTGSRFLVSPNVWRRNFTNGVAIANPDASASQTVALGGTYLTPDGATVTSVTLGPRQGMALRDA
jgi:hypothetical protein